MPVFLFINGLASLSTPFLPSSVFCPCHFLHEFYLFIFSCMNFKQFFLESQEVKILFSVHQLGTGIWPWLLYMGCPCGSAGKESATNAGDLGAVPGLGISPGERKGYPLQYSGLENSMDCTVHGVANSWIWLSDFHFTSLCIWKTFKGGT